MLRIFWLFFLISIVFGAGARAETLSFTKNLSLGATDSQVIALQQALNRDPTTLVAASGPGSPGNETDYFGPLTKAAVIRFQEKYAGEVLTPAGLTKGSGYVGSYTRAKLSAISASKAKTAVAAPATLPAATSTPPRAPSTTAAYLVKEYEKIDTHAGDKLLENIQDRIRAAVNATADSLGTIPLVLPTITEADIPSIVIKTLSPSSGTPGTHVSVAGSNIGISSVVYFGSEYIVRALSQDAFGNLSFVIPPIPPARYDLVVKTGSAISNTTPFVITTPKNPSTTL